MRREAEEIAAESAAAMEEERHKFEVEKSRQEDEMAAKLARLEKMRSEEADSVKAAALAAQQAEMTAKYEAEIEKQKGAAATAQAARKADQAANAKVATKAQAELKAAQEAAHVGAAAKAQTMLEEFRATAETERKALEHRLNAEAAARSKADAAEKAALTEELRKFREAANQKMVTGGGWKDRAGRVEGSKGYEFGDVTRTTFAFFQQKMVTGGFTDGLASALFGTGAAKHETADAPRGKVDEDTPVERKT